MEKKLNIWGSQVNTSLPLSAKSISYDAKEKRKKCVINEDSKKEKKKIINDMGIMKEVKKEEKNCLLNWVIENWSQERRLILKYNT